MTDWRDQFTTPRCGYVQYGDGKDRHRYLTDYGTVILPARPEVDDPALLAKMQEFARERWVKGRNEPFRWKGKLP